MKDWYLTHIFQSLPLFSSIVIGIINYLLLAPFITLSIICQLILIIPQIQTVTLLWWLRR